MSNLYETFRKFLSGCPEMIQMKKQNNKQTNKLTIFWWSLSKLNQFQSLRNFQEIFLGVFIDDSNENKQTNKQINNFRSKISQLNQVQSLQKFQEIFLGVSQDDSNEKINKQTDKLLKKLLINNILAKSSPIFMKLSGIFFRGDSEMTQIIKKTKINKQK